MNTAAPLPPEALAGLAQQILDAHHARLWRELPELAAALQGGPRPVRDPFLQLKDLVELHMRKEEQILFPAILRLCAGEDPGGCGLRAPIAQLRHEHGEIALYEQELRRAIAAAAGPGGPTGPLAQLVALLDDLVVHSAREDEGLFPGALALLDGEGADIDDAPPVGPAPAPRPAADPGLLRRTRGVCSTCLAEVDAEVRIEDGRALLVKRCPAHGRSAQLLSPHGAEWAELDRFFFQVNPADRPRAQRDYIVRMTERCNLDCPICLARANTQDTPDLPLEGLERLLSDRRGLKVDLMAAEPTLREDLLDWVKKVKAAGHTAALHTNGLKLAHMPFARAVRDAGVSEVFLQFDGLDDAANVTLRGRPLHKARLAALKNLRELGVAVSLIVVIARGVNEDQLGPTLRFAAQEENRHIREVFFLGLRSLGSARASGAFADQALMPDELVDLLCAQVPGVRRPDIRDFNKLYFTMLSAFLVRKCLYVQHYMVSRDGRGGVRPIADDLDLRALAQVCERYAPHAYSSPHLARARLLPALARAGLRARALPLVPDLLRLEGLFARGFKLDEVPSRFLLIGFITACDPDNYDAMVSVGCGKGELSADGGFTESGADANIGRERRFAAGPSPSGAPSGRAPGA